MAALLVLAASAGKAPSSSAHANTWQAFPRVTLWAWESPQDLRRISPERYAVAYLAQTIFITDGVAGVPRKQPLLLPPGARVTAVVRIEAPRSSARLDDPRLTATVADLIVEPLRRKQVSALQIDFDATKSQWAFYRTLLKETRRRMPVDMPLSITALASWCSQPSWMEGLPVDEAVPMLFRMGERARVKRSPGWSYQATETSCQGSVGVSTDEPWPAIGQKQRIYVFHPRAWNPVALENLEKLIQP
ncbi:MAG TPA: DUF3142 domain-containing protein [Candidatus Angelobacter sp.]